MNLTLNITDKSKHQFNTELEQLIINDIGNTNNWLIYADWLLLKGNSRGEIIVKEIMPVKNRAILGAELSDLYRKYIPEYSMFTNTGVPDHLKCVKIARSHFKYGFLSIYDNIFMPKITQSHRFCTEFFIDSRRLKHSLNTDSDYVNQILKLKALRNFYIRLKPTETISSVQAKFAQTIASLSNKNTRVYAIEGMHNAIEEARAMVLI